MQTTVPQTPRSTKWKESRDLDLAKQSKCLGSFFINDLYFTLALCKSRIYWSTISKIMSIVEDAHVPHAPQRSNVEHWSEGIMLGISLRIRTGHQSHPSPDRHRR